MTDYISSFFDNYKSKIRNPFIGTMISVWFIRNWKVVFAFFNFDKNRNMEWKIKYISNYFKKIYFWEEFGIVIGIAFASLVLTFILLGVSRSLTDMYYKIIEPYIVTRIDRKQIFTVEEREELGKRITSLENKLEKSKDDVFKAEKNNENLEFKITTNEKFYSDKLQSLANENMEVTKKFDELDSNSKKLKEMFEQFEKVHRSLNRDINDLLLDVRHNQRIKVNSKSLDRAENLAKLKDLGFLKEDLSGDNYELTQLGIVFLNGYNFIEKTEAK